MKTEGEELLDWLEQVRRKNEEQDTHRQMFVEGFIKGFILGRPNTDGGWPIDFNTKDLKEVAETIYEEEY